MTTGFVWKRRIGFGDCDPARIAYTGQLANIALEALDAFWEDLLDGEGWYQMNVDRGYGMPFVHMEYDFSRPVTAGDPLFCSISPVKVGDSSVSLKLVARQRDQICFEASFVSVFVEADSKTKISIPAHIRDALSRIL